MGLQSSELDSLSLGRKRRYPLHLCSDREALDCGRLVEKWRGDVDRSLDAHEYKQFNHAKRDGGIVQANISVQTLVATLGEINEHLHYLRSNYQNKYPEVRHEIRFFENLVENVRIEESNYDSFSEDAESMCASDSEDSQIMLVDEDTPLMLGAISFYEEEDNRRHSVEYDRSTNASVVLSRPLYVRNNQNPYIYVDASGKGIGITVSSRNKWLAWTYKKQSPSSRVRVDHVYNEHNNMDIVWAELVAVELGLRAAAIMCYTGEILMFSDNRCVFDIMGQRYVNPERRRLQRIMHRINNLCKKANLQPNVKWVPTAWNRADAPSRGKFKHLGPVLELAPTLPYSLSEVLTLATDEDHWRFVEKPSAAKNYHN